MPRTARKYKLSDSLVYHIINRGILKHDIFHDQRDVNSFLKIVARYAQLFEFSIYHWCVMHNHFHLILKLRDFWSLSKAIGGLQQVYARRYHKRYNTAGRLFQSRFKSQAIEQSSYLLACARYVERNPVRAGLVTVPWEWPWSSARFYVLGENDPLVTPDPEWTAMGTTVEERRKAYREWLLDKEKAIAEEKYFKSNTDVLGSESFLMAMGIRQGRPRPRTGRPPKIVSR